MNKTRLRKQRFQKIVIVATTVVVAAGTVLPIMTAL